MVLAQSLCCEWLIGNQHIDPLTDTEVIVYHLEQVHAACCLVLMKRARKMEMWRRSYAEVSQPERQFAFEVTRPGSWRLWSIVLCLRSSLVLPHSGTR